MPELPDVELYLSALRPRVLGEVLQRVELFNPFVLRSVDPPLRAVEGATVHQLSRLGKRIVFGLEGDLYLIVHLMIAGRFRWHPDRKAPPKRLSLAAMHFSSGLLVLTEAGTKRRAALYVVKGREGLAAHDPGGLEVLDLDLAGFRSRLLSESHTLKRALTDPTIFSGIGNAYSDEILHGARLSPLKLTGQLGEPEIERLYRAVRDTLVGWRDRLLRETAGAFPAKVTAFREGMAVHGRFGQPCPVCATAVQRIAYAQNEVNYCPTCQTGGKLLADRALSRLLKSDWPKTLEELEERRRGSN